jgi:hypothetical protein
LLHHLLGYLPLAVHGIGGDHPPRQRKQLQQLGQRGYLAVISRLSRGYLAVISRLSRGYLVGLASNGHLAQRQPLFRSPGIDQMQG